jgi:Zn-dependent metalloprotease
MDPSKDPISVYDTPQFLTEVLGLSKESTFILQNSISNAGFEVFKFQQYNNSFKVEHGVFKAITKNGTVLAYTAEYYNLPPNLSATAGLSEDAALQSALTQIGAVTYAWEYVETLEDSPEKTAAYNELYPKGELVLVDDYATSVIDISLAYKFNIYAAEPLSRNYVYVDANTGDILLMDAIIKHAEGIHTKEDVVRSIEESKRAKNTAAPSPVFLTGKGDTRYAGNRNFDFQRC